MQYPLTALLFASLLSQSFRILSSLYICLILLYYIIEWTMIFVFIVVAILRIISIIKFSNLNLHDDTAHVDLQPIALILAYEQVRKRRKIDIL